MKPGPLFPGAYAKIRFGKLLSSLLKKDGTSKTYGTHSVRKGVATFACGGSTGGPSIDRYFRYEAAGDQFLGRVVAGLPVNDSKFAALPPHFSKIHETIVNSGVKNMFPRMDEDKTFGRILQLCLASLVYHAEYFLDKLPSNHPLTYIFTNASVLHDLRAKLEDGEPEWMQPTGIPPHIELYKKLDSQQRSIDALLSILEHRMEQVLERKGVVAGNITRQMLRDEIQSLLAEVGLRSTTTTDPETASLPSGPPRHYHIWGGSFTAEKL
ncbi:hypothetical protein JG688_00018620 [Phytophthora aleatoria]|uniref:Uncharacterized protein n=1 Tax=Phytophthora aleatoria TaxID=2496075 RepID=A0A8J5IPA8_9STRA|nr:hypothetical protein JG688_00018620 [Phytophthora aleatoria]